MEDYYMPLHLDKLRYFFIWKNEKKMYYLIIIKKLCQKIK